MPFYASPGIYVEEVPSGARPIGAVGTSTAGFVGSAPDPPPAATRRSRSTTGRSSCGSTPRGPTYRAPRWPARSSASSTTAAAAATWSTSARARRSPAAAAAAPGWPLLEAIDEVAIVAAPGYTDACPTRRCSALRAARRPGRHPRPAGGGHRHRRADPGRRPPGKDGGKEAEEAKAADSGGGLRPRQSDYGTFYFPWLVVRDPLTGEPVATPPSGHIAGIWARTDTTARGAQGAGQRAGARRVDLTYRITRAEQDVLNPIGVNCIRYFPAEGIRVWGARTLAAEASEWRYLNVRRLFNMLKESIADGTRWIVFEPNDQSLWRSIRRDIGAFLTRVWRDGALMGRTAAGGVLRQVRRGDQPAGGPRRRPGRRRDRRRAGEAGRVRRVQAEPVGRRHRHRDRWEADMPEVTATRPPSRATGSTRTGPTTSSCSSTT